MKRNIYLHGALGRQFGRVFALDVDSPAEAVRALGTLRPALKRLIAAGWWRVIVGSPHLANAIEPAAVHMRLGTQPMHLVPATPVAGGDSGNIGKIILGVVLIGAAFALTGGALGGVAIGFLGMTGTQMAFMGGAILLGGVAGLMTPSPTPAETSQFSRPEDRPSFVFSGIVNNSQEGGALPVIWGRFLVGSILVNAGIQIEDGVA